MKRIKADDAKPAREGAIVHGTVHEYGGGEFRVLVDRGTECYPGLGTEGVWVPKEIYEELFKIHPSEFGRAPRQADYHYGVRSPVEGCPCGACNRLRAQDDLERQIVREEINTAIKAWNDDMTRRYR